MGKPSSIHTHTLYGYFSSKEVLKNKEFSCVEEQISVAKAFFVCKEVIL